METVISVIKACSRVLGFLSVCETEINGMIHLNVFCVHCSFCVNEV